MSKSWEFYQQPDAGDGIPYPLWWICGASNTYHLLDIDRVAAGTHTVKIKVKLNDGGTYEQQVQVDFQMVDDDPLPGCANAAPQ